MVLPPNGKPMYVYFRKGQGKRQVVNEVILPRWMQFCNDNWLSDDVSNPWCAERRVKTFLDSVAYLLLRDNPEDTLTLYKECARGSSEIPVSSCPAYIGDMLYADGTDLHDNTGMGEEQFTLMLEELDAQTAKHLSSKRAQDRACKPRPETRLDKLERIKRQYPGCVFSFHRVDTENCFAIEGEEYEIDESLEAYMPTDTAEGDWYEMDEVMAVRAADGALHFYDQRLEPIDDDMIRQA